MDRKVLIAAGLTLIAAFAVLLNSLNAASPKKNEIAKELREEIKSYTEKNILPEMQQWKALLDNSMAKDDLAKLNELRAKASAIREEMTKEKTSLFNESKEEKWSKDELKDKMKDEKKEYKAELKEIMVQLKPIAEKYTDILKNIGEKAKPKRDEWENGILIIVNNWKNEHKEELENMKGKRKIDAHAFKRSTGLNKLGFDGDKKKKAAMFMLWDGKKPFGVDGGIGINKSIKTVPREGTAGFRPFPNPFNEKTTIYFNLEKQENVNLSVFDDTGNKIAEIFDGELAKGEHSFIFNSKAYKNLAAGTFTCKLTTGTETKTVKMLFTK